MTQLMNIQDINSLSYEELVQLFVQLFPKTFLDYFIECLKDAHVENCNREYEQMMDEALQKDAY